jgi:protein involved in polysaccharide export with SLBB domain
LGICCGRKRHLQRAHRALNDVQAAGLTPMQLTAVINEGLKKYITNPQVTVGLVEINSRRISVNGDVLRAEVFPLLPNMTVLQALSSAEDSLNSPELRVVYGKTKNE